MTHILSLFDPSPYVAAWELNGKDLTVTIDRVEKKEVVGEGGKKSRKPVMTFRDFDRPFVFGKKVAKTLIALYGSDVNVYPGKRITLYPTQDRGPEGEMVDAIRVRKTVPKASAPSLTLPERAERLAASLKSAESTASIDSIWQSAVKLRDALATSDVPLLDELTEMLIERRAVLTEREEAL
jgi:hypothetical protein